MSQVYTFYSYKGGVGRTMALANIAVVLSKWGHKVLIVDWDLEAPGLEHFFKAFIDFKTVESIPGVIDLLQVNETVKWQDCIYSFKTSVSEVPIDLITSGKRDADYFNKVRNFDVNTFYENDNGGDIIENLRDEWLANYDYVLVDSRTGITEIGGICTIQLPDTVVMLFTATDQGFEGVLDIMKRASAAQQKLTYDRLKLIFLPIPSKFDSNPEFKLSQEWMERFANELEPAYNDWLPSSQNRKDFLNLTKIPYMSYFSFGEKLPVIEQGVKDPSGLGYAYESLAALIGNHLNNVDWLSYNREQYIGEVNKFHVPGTEIMNNGNGSDFEKRLRHLKKSLNVGEEIKVIKNIESVIECFETNILPVINLISEKCNQLDVLFKSKEEGIILYNEKTNKYSYDFDAEIIIKQLKTNYPFDNLIYFYQLSEGRKGLSEKLEIGIGISIEFHTNSFEVKFFQMDSTLNIDKLYHERITEEELTYIANAYDTYFNLKIKSAT